MASDHWISHITLVKLCYRPTISAESTFFKLWCPFRIHKKMTILAVFSHLHNSNPQSMLLKFGMAYTCRYKKSCLNSLNTDIKDKMNTTYWSFRACTTEFHELHVRQVQSRLWSQRCCGLPRQVTAAMLPQSAKHMNLTTSHDRTQ